MMETRDKKRFGNKQQRKYHQITKKKDILLEMKTQMQNSSPTHTHREKPKQKQTLSTATQDRQVGSFWDVAPQEVNHDWLTMMVPGSVADHLLA